jgi:hypothetical protein
VRHFVHRLPVVSGAEKEIAAEQRFSVLTRLIVAAAPAVSAAPRAAPVRHLMARGGKLLWQP